MLRNQAKTAVLWSGLDTLIRQGFGFVISVVLARLLVPDDFGTVALLAIFIGVANLFVNAGLGLALIQRQDVTHEDESTVFWFNLSVAFLMMLGLCASAEWIAAFFDKPVLVPLTIVLAINIFISAFGTIHGTLMTKRLDFKTPMKVGVSTSIAGGLVAVYMAWDGYGLWSLVGQTLTGNVLGVILLWRLSPWRPAFNFSVASFRKLFGFSGWLFLSSLLDVVYQRGYTMLIGKFYGTHDLGIYNRADNTQVLVSGLLTDVLSRVAFPLFSAVNNDPGKIRRGMQMAVQTMMLITAPSMIGLAVLSEPFIRIFFGDQWSASAPILQALCFAGLLYPIHVTNLKVLQSLGRSDLFFKLEIYKKLFGVTILVTGSAFGLLGIAIARAFSSFLAIFINSFYTNRLINYDLTRQTKDILPSLYLSSLMAGAVHFLHSMLNNRGPVLLFEFLLLVAFGVFSYWFLNVAFKSKAYFQALHIVLSKSK